MNMLPYSAMVFAYEKHKSQVRKYTGEPYTAHLGEVAGIVAAVNQDPEAIATAWLHDVWEDQGVTPEELINLFGVTVGYGVVMLSDMEEGNRAERKAKSCERLAQASGWVQTIKCADLISNTKSIVLHDPKFAVTYLKEKQALLKVLTKADRRLWNIATELAHL